MTAIQVAAQNGNPSYRLVQRWHRVWWPGGSMHAAIQGSPFDGLEDYLTRQLTVQPCQQRGVEDAPGNEREQRGSPNKAFECAELAGLCRISWPRSKACRLVCFDNSSGTFIRGSSGVVCCGLRPTSQRLAAQHR